MIARCAACRSRIAACRPCTRAHQYRQRAQATAPAVWWMERRAVETIAAMVEANVEARRAVACSVPPKLRAERR